MPYNVYKYFFVGLAQYVFQELNFCSHEQCLHVAGMDALLYFTMAKLLIFTGKLVHVYISYVRVCYFVPENCCREFNDIGCCKVRVVSLLDQYGSLLCSLAEL